MNTINPTFLVRYAERNLNLQKELRFAFDAECIYNAMLNLGQRVRCKEIGEEVFRMYGIRLSVASIAKRLIPMKKSGMVKRTEVKGEKTHASIRYGDKIYEWDYIPKTAYYEIGA